MFQTTEHSGAILKLNAIWKQKDVFSVISGNLLLGIIVKEYSPNLKYKLCCQHRLEKQQYIDKELGVYVILFTVFKNRLQVSRESNNSLT